MNSSGDEGAQQDLQLLDHASIARISFKRKLEDLEDLNLLTISEGLLQRARLEVPMGEDINRFNMESISGDSAEPQRGHIARGDTAELQRGGHIVRGDTVLGHLGEGVLGRVEATIVRDGPLEVEVVQDVAPHGPAQAVSLFNVEVARGARDVLLSDLSEMREVLGDMAARGAQYCLRSSVLGEMGELLGEMGEAREAGTAPAGTVGTELAAGLPAGLVAVTARTPGVELAGAEFPMGEAGTGGAEFPMGEAGMEGVDLAGKPGVEVAGAELPMGKAGTGGVELAGAEFPIGEAGTGGVELAGTTGVELTGAEFVSMDLPDSPPGAAFFPWEEFCMVEGSGGSSRPLVHFFVRGYEKGTIVLHMPPESSIGAVHEVLVQRTGIPLQDQRLVYGGRQLYHEHTLLDLKITDNVTLQLNSRMRSTEIPKTWKIVSILVNDINDLMSFRRQSRGQEAIYKGIKSFLRKACEGVEFSRMANGEKEKNRSIAEQMEVFHMAGGTTALLKLLLSGVPSLSDCAETAVNLFISDDEDNAVPHDVYPHCGPILLQFCQSLSRTAPEHRVYLRCRKALASLVDQVGLVPGAAGFGKIAHAEVIELFAPLLDDLYKALYDNLCKENKEVQTLEGLASSSGRGRQLSIAHAHDFMLFLVPVCRAMQVCHRSLLASICTCDKCRIPRRGKTVDGKPLDQSMNGGDCKWNTGNNPAVDPGTKLDPRWSLEWLQHCCWQLFQWVLRLLADFERLMKEEDDMHTRFFKSFCKQSALLPTLKALYQFACKFPVYTYNWLEELRGVSRALNYFIQNANSVSQEAPVWMLPLKELLSFETKRKLALTMLPEPNDDHDERVEVMVFRGASLLADSFEALAYVNAKQVQNGVSVEFTDENATGPGVIREWFALVVRELFNPQNALFVACPHDRRRFYPNAASGVNPGHLMYFRFCGRILALALLHRVQLDIVLSKALYKQLTDQSVLLEDLEEIEPELYHHCRNFMELKPEAVEAVGVTFTWDIEELGVRRTIELVPDGENRRVTKANLEEFIDLLIQRRLANRVSEQVRALGRGMRDLLKEQKYLAALQMLDPEDFNLLLHGTDEGLSTSDWKQNTEYHDYSSTDPEITWFWEVVEEMDQERRARLLFFATAVMRLPVEGFAGLPSKFHIHKSNNGPNYCPKAHTCFYQLCLPLYTSLEMTRERLYTITELHPTVMGFGFP